MQAGFNYENLDGLLAENLDLSLGERLTLHVSFDGLIQVKSDSLVGDLGFNFFVPDFVSFESSSVGVLEFLIIFCDTDGQPYE